MIYGYGRVSAKDQNLATQIEQLERFGCEKIITEKISGVAKNKFKLDELLESMISEDTLVVTRMDRLGRSTTQLLNLVEELNARDIHLVIMSPNIDTRDHVFGKFFLTVLSGFAEMERELIKEKQRNGIEIAKRDGKYKGRKKKYTRDHMGMGHALELYHSGKKSVKEITEITGVSRSALYRELKKREEKELING